MSLNGDREAVEKLVDAALASLEANRRRIDDLNVYPVPDGDTGTNMTMTVRAVAEAVDHTSAAGRQSLARDVARGALMGARGNSGVIFSQIVRGAADVLGETGSGPMEAQASAQPQAPELLGLLVHRGEAALARTPEQLQVLRDAGVVDAGGAGLVEIVRGVAAAVSGEPLPEPAPVEEH